ncbi:ribonuclease HII [Peptostreptococcus sp. D1]|uniref:ribonuclease HII n=1 Tax=Peptostreptococcus sp. D1 TaxID=72304 RepID=UPI0008DEFA8B|nr:ribonuclease HII [Peptostreptococcus sp. D1]SFE64564.1 RNase HII [Peptostreptococcus sp. D1]
MDKRLLDELTKEYYNISNLDNETKSYKSIKVSTVKELYSSISLDTINDNDTSAYLELIDRFADCIKNDDRKSVIDIAQKLEIKKQKYLSEINRLDMLNQYENRARKNGFKIIGGVDEAGRGPLAGPVVAAVVVYKGPIRINKINDSKKLSEKNREELFDIIKEKAYDYGIGVATPDEIDEHNILNATYIAMKRAIDKLKYKPDYLINDAVIIPNMDMRQESLIKGDSKSISIASASILAKVTRDRLMYEYDKRFPEYSFSSNKGYGTEGHYEAIKKYGITSIHRLSFLKNFTEFFDEKNVRK